MRVAQSLATAVWTGRDAFPRPKGNRQRQSSRWRVQCEGEEQGPQAAAWSQRWLNARAVRSWAKHPTSLPVNPGDEDADRGAHLVRCGRIRGVSLWRGP